MVSRNLKNERKEQNKRNNFRFNELGIVDHYTLQFISIVDSLMFVFQFSMTGTSPGLIVIIIIFFSPDRSRLLVSVTKSKGRATLLTSVIK